MKRTISLLLVFVMIFACLPVMAFATESASGTFGAQGDNLTWTLDDDGILTISGTGYMDDPVPWDSYRDSIKKVKIGNGVRDIGWDAFCNCVNLTEVTIGEDVTRLRNYAFENCTSLTKITIPDSVTSIGNYAFYRCTSLTDVTIPDSVTNIGNYVFQYCDSLKKVTIGENVTQIGYYAFSYCSSLMEIVIPDSVTSLGFSAFSNCYNLTDVTIGSGVTSINSDTFSYCSSLTDVTIPDNVTSIGLSAFRDCYNLTNLTIGNGVTSIDNYAFQYCHNLTQVTMGNSVVDIGNSAFYECYGLTEITIPDSVTSIGHAAFKGCTSLTKATLGENVTNIDGWAFLSCGLTEITIPDSVTSIGQEAFRSCTNLTGIWVGENNQYYSSDEYGVLFNKDKTELIMAPGAISGAYSVPDSVTSIHDHAFKSCRKLTGITIPDSVTSIGQDAFMYCESLTDITIPDGVTSIGDQTFCECDSLVEITIPDQVTSIGDRAFEGCSSLKSVTIPDGITSISSNAFSHCDSLIFNKYRNAWYLGNANNPYVALICDDNIASESCDIHQNTRIIAENAFYYSSLTEITIPDSVTSIGQDAFNGCKNLTKVIIGNSVEKIEDSVFVWSTKLNEIYFEGSAPAIGNNVFYKVTATAYYYPDSTWTADVMQNYGGTITWVARCAHSNTEVVNAVQATCTEDGYTGDTVCADCGTTVAEGSVIPGLNHTIVHAAETCTTVEYWYCAVCDTYFADAALTQLTNRLNTFKVEPTHTFVDGVCSVCGEADPNAELIKWVGTQVQANSNLDMQFALKASDFEGTTGNYIVLTRTYADGTTDVVTINQADWTKSDNFYIVAYSGIAAKEMGDVIEAVVYNAEGKVISEVRAESIETYALSMLGKITNAEQKTMFVDLLNYGAEAQKFFGHNADKLVNAGLTEEQKGWATQSDVEVSDNRVKGDNFFGTNLSLENVVLMQFAFKVTPVDGMYAEVTYTNYRGVAKTETLAVENNNGYAMVSVNSLAFADYETMVTCTLYNADGTVAGSATDSMASYAARANNTLAKALMKFCASAYAYFM